MTKSHATKNHMTVFGCCGSSKKMSKREKRMPTDQHVWKEGFMEKKTGLLKTWKSRYFVLLDDLLCYFLKEEQKETLKPTGRIFYSDIISVERVEKKSHPYSIQVEIDTKHHIMSCTSYEDREDWVNKMWESKEKHKNQELRDPVRRSSTKLGKDYKRITIKKDPKHGMGCTIKNVGGAIFVSRIIPDGPVATSGVLRPGDQLIDINGTRVSECPIDRIKEIIRGSPEYIVCTVKPVTHYTSHEESPQTIKRNPYTEVDPERLNEDVVMSKATPYTTVTIVPQKEEEEVTESPKNSESDDTQNIEHQNYMNYEVKKHENVSKKATNYAELEFGSKKK